MEFEIFLKIIENLKQINDNIQIAYKININLIDFTSKFYETTDLLIKEIYGVNGLLWWEWFIYENNFGEGGLEAYDENKNKICYDYKSLWEHLENIKTNKI